MINPKAEMIRQAWKAPLELVHQTNPNYNVPGHWIESLGPAEREALTRLKSDDIKDAMVPYTIIGDEYDRKCKRC